MRRKKSASAFIVVLVLAALAAIAVFWGKPYYDRTYVGKDYYAMVPLDFEMKQVRERDSNGNEVGGLCIEYNLTAFDENGNSKKVVVVERGEDLSAYPAPGAYLYVKASETREMEHKVIKQYEVPEKALAAIEKNS